LQQACFFPAQVKDQEAPLFLSANGWMVSGCGSFSARLKLAAIVRAGVEFPCG